MSTIIMAIVAILVLVLAYCHTRTTQTHSVTAVESINVDECMEAFIMVLVYTKATLKEERLSGRRARTRAWHNNNCAHKESVRKARKEAMQHVSSAQRKAEKVSKANQWMIGKSWQDAIHALYSEGKLVSTRSKADIRPAMAGTKTTRVTAGKKLLVLMSGIKSIAQRDAEYKSTHIVVGSKRRTAPTWGMWRKVVSKEQLAFLLDAKNASAYKVAA